MKNIFKPTLFSTPMVQAILEGRKNQTRRTKGLEHINKNPDNWLIVSDWFASDGICISEKNTDQIFYPKEPCSVGEIIWVRETFLTQPYCPHKIAYKADYTPEMLSKLKKYQKWKPSIFMPKHACRIFLKVKSVSIERLQEITAKDCIAEGVSDRLKFSDFPAMAALRGEYIPNPFTSHQFGFMALWCKINGPKSWLSNPWVWRIEFERIEKPLDFI